MKTIAVFARATIGSNTAYRGAVVIWMLTSLVRIAVALFVWMSSGNSVLGGYPRSALVGYYLVAWVFDWLFMWNPFTPMVQEIQSGRILTYLVRPVSYLWASTGKEVGFKSIALVFLVPIGTGLAIAFGNMSIPIDIHGDWDWMFLAVAIPGTIAISFLLTMCMVTLAFWFTEVRHVNYLYWTVMPLLGGMFLPTSFLPRGLEHFNWLLPFRYHLSFPLEIVFHRLDATGLAISLLFMTLWIVILSSLYRYLWREGVKAYAAFGQ